MCWGIRRSREGQHKVRPTATQMCTIDHISHTFLLHTKATERKGDGEGLYKATNLFPENAPSMCLISWRCGLSGWREIQQFYQVSSVSKQQEKKKKKFVWKQLRLHSWELYVLEEEFEEVSISSCTAVHLCLCENHKHQPLNHGCHLLDTVSHKDVRIYLLILLLILSFKIKWC